MTKVKLGAKLNTNYDLEAVREILNSHEVTEIEFVDEINWIWFHVDISLSESIMDKLHASEHVCLVERSVPLKIQGIKVPNDPFYAAYQSRQYDEMQVLQGWQITQGSQSVTVGVVDTGADLTHPDLVDNLDAGYNVVSGGDGSCGPSSDTGTGSHGTMVAGGIVAKPNNNRGVTGVAPGCRVTPIRANAVGSYNGFDTSGIQQGIIKAATNGCKLINISIGYPISPIPVTPLTTTTCEISGISGLMNHPVTWYDSSSCAKGRVVDEVYLSNSVRITINWVEGNAPTYPFTSLALPDVSIQSAIDYAWGQGATIFAATGNEGLISLSSICGSVHTISVAATDGNKLISYSNRGPWVDFCAPPDAMTTYPMFPTHSSILISLKGDMVNGSNIINNVKRANGNSITVPGNEGCLVIGPWDAANCIVACGDTWMSLQYPANQTGTINFDAYYGAGYAAGSGTSFACPTATGLGALLLSANPSLTNTQIKSIIKSTSTPLSGAAPYTSGAGKINFYNALLQVAKLCTSTSPGEGTYVGPKDITFNVDKTSDVTLPVRTWYTTDGSDPTTSPTRAEYTGAAVRITKPSTVKYYSVDSSPTPVQESIKSDVYDIQALNVNVPVTGEFTVGAYTNLAVSIVAGKGIVAQVGTFTVHTPFNPAVDISAYIPKDCTADAEEVYMLMALRPPSCGTTATSNDAIAPVDGFSLSILETTPKVYTDCITTVPQLAFGVTASAVSAVASQVASAYTSSFTLGVYGGGPLINAVASTVCSAPALSMSVGSAIGSILFSGVSNALASTPSLKMGVYIYPVYIGIDRNQSFRIRAPDGTGIVIKDIYGSTLIIKTKNPTEWE